MAYTIFRADGTSVSVPDNTISNTFYNPNANGVGKGVGVQLLGRNVIDYGAAVAQDFVQLMANFAGTTTPSDATSQVGQTWFNTVDATLYVKFTTANSGINNWKAIGTGSSIPQVGEPLYDVEGTLLGYSTPSIPSDSSVSDYVPLNLDTNTGWAGWARLVSGDGMTEQLTDVVPNVIGYIFPPTL